LFTRSEHYSDEVVISAHGGYKPEDLEFDVKTELRFYSVLDAPANASGLICYSNMVKETIKSGGSSKNYRLSKFQGSHGSESGKAVETYGSIQTTLEESVSRIAEHNDLFITSSREELAKTGLTDPVKLFDVATVRNRGWKKEVRLQYVIEQLLGKHAYSVVHCSFCRVRI